MAALLTGSPATATSITNSSDHHSDIAQCGNEFIIVDTQFPTGNIASCAFVTKGHINIKIAAEDDPPINCSAWYAFRLTSQKHAKLRITLDYEICGHRYNPKISTDGQNWTTLRKDMVEVGTANGIKYATFTVSVGEKPLFIAAQEIIAPATYENWINHLTKADHVTSWELGKSVENRPILAFSIKAADSQPNKQIVITGRQHPPEITGALALFAFVEHLASDDPQAVRFRKEYEIIVIPMMNPDGVVHGHWRHNSQGIDLNRDWGPFSQPETRAVEQFLREIDDDPHRDLQLLIDFHSTWNDVFYTIGDEYPTDPAFFIPNWLSQLQKQMPDYKVNRSSNHEAGRPISKTYAFDTYNVPAVTFELGDNTDRTLISRLGREAAIAMIKTLFEKDTGNVKKQTRKTE